MNDIHSLTGAYVADALEDNELEEFDNHLAGCTDCRDDVASLRETMAEIGALHEVSPPPALRSSILDAISSTAQLPAEDSDVTPVMSVTPEEDTTTSNVVTPTHRFGRPRRPVATWLAAAAAVLAVALGGVTVWQQSNLQSIQAAEAQRAELITAPDLQVNHATLDGGELTYLVSLERGRAIMASSDLPDPGSDRSWQVWVMQDAVPRSGAVVDVGGTVQAWIDGVDGGEALAITNEPRGGSPAPTGEVLAAFEF